MSVHEEELKEVGLRVTGPRLKVLALLERHRDQHLSADDLYGLLRDDGEEVGVATVYRVLAQFEAAGMVKRLGFNADRAVYELADEEHHDHVVCIDCGRVAEFCNAEVEAKLDGLVCEMGFRPVFHDLNLYAICSSCLGNQR
jgi:Fur family ferric uptake transcriptional regulator